MYVHADVYNHRAGSLLLRQVEPPASPHHTLSPLAMMEELSIERLLPGCAAAAHMFPQNRLFLPLLKKPVSYVCLLLCLLLWTLLWTAATALQRFIVQKETVFFGKERKQQAVLCSITTNPLHECKGISSTSTKSTHTPDSLLQRSRDYRYDRGETEFSLLIKQFLPRDVGSNRVN